MTAAFPRMIRVRQKFPTDRVEDIPGETRRQLETLNLAGRIRPGQTVALTAGSRGIANIDVILKAIVVHLQELGAKPFIVPAMGSHGGGTAEGQRDILAGYGVTPERMGCEIKSSMETVIVDHTPHGVPVHFDKYASEADRVFVCNRVKPHTGFVGAIESGLHKMMLIGLGKHEGAKIYHRAILDHSFMEIITAVGGSVLKKCRVAGGVAIVENAYDETKLIEAVPPEKFFDREQELLKIAVESLPRLPFVETDLLIIDRIGKNISGTGLDTNVVGRKFSDHAPTERDTVRVRRIFVRGLTEETHGNATGIGIAEFTNERTIAQVDRKKTGINCITGLHPSAAMLPIAFDTDRESIDAALQTVGLVEPPDAKVVQIADTLHLAEVLVSEAYLPELRQRTDLEIVSDPEPMAFDAAGNLQPVSGS
ncbi:lactate racemase domain-containing protein [Planctellipticum variicoloris]|uniref:lactate racemase domain-containing protein n=1 Tax=Planctellipticum variicoloris TaxID=3064265 RepID=UPI0030136179|nr:nickel-dependent lactate racemase [Planctomycetaceae bacterium SH412]